jgi:hypothetical protein
VQNWWTIKFERFPVLGWFSSEKMTMSYVVRRAALFLGALSLAGAASVSYAFPPSITDDTSTLGEGGQQLEWSYGRSKASGQAERTGEHELVYTLGVTENLDVFASTAHTRGADGNGWLNPRIGAKWRFFSNGDESTTLALRPELVGPVSRQRELSGLGTGEWSGHLTLVLSQTVPFGAVHVNMGVGRDRFRKATQRADIDYQRMSVVPVWAVNDKLSLAVDMGFERAREAGQRTTTRFQELSMVLAIRKDLDWALGLLTERGPDQKTSGWTTGLAWRF